MTRKEKAVIRAALWWYREHRPYGWTRTAWRKNPLVNCHYRDGAVRLAKACAKLEFGK